MRLGHSHGRSDSKQGNTQHFQAGETRRAQNRIMALKAPSIDRFPKPAVPNEGLSPDTAFVTKDEVFNVHLEVLTCRGSLGSYISLTPP